MPTRAARFFQTEPQLRERLLGDPGFRGWLQTFPGVQVDEATLYVVGGDMLRDEDEMALEWARRSGEVTDGMLAAAERAGGSD